MKKISILIGILFLCGIFICHEFKGNYSSFIKREFNLEFDKTILRKIREEEQWLGNGEKLVILGYNKLNNGISRDLQKLPIKEEISPNRIPREYLNSSNGYYKYIIDENDNRNFKIIIIDVIKKEICIYYQIM